MQLLSPPHPRTPDARSTGRFLFRLARDQWRTIALGAAFGVIWMVSLALLPWAVGHGVDAIAGGDRSQVLRWSLILLGIGASIAISGGLRHWCAVTNWLLAAFRSAGHVHEHALRVGPALTRQVPTGEVVAIFTNDVMRIGSLYDVTARFTGALVAYAVVGVLLLRANLQIGLLVLIGGPLLLGSLSLIVRPLQKRQAAQREEAGHLTTLGADTVAGLRVLRGIGGEETFLRRYEAQSATVRRAGWRVAGLQSALDSSQVLIPGIFVALVTWVGARAVLRGEVSVGQLVAFFGYASFLTLPMNTVIEFIDRYVRARIGAGKVVRILHVTPDHTQAPDHTEAPAELAANLVVPQGDPILTDEISRATVRAGLMTAVVSATPQDSAELLDRLGRLAPAGSAGVHLAGQPMQALTLQQVRDHVVVSESDPRLFAGPLRSALTLDRVVPPAHVEAAIATASAGDAVDALPEGLDGELEERARSLSGGQRQRLALARALLTDAEVLALIEPTSAVDAHTEARIAGRLAAHRRGRTTIIATVSPLMLDVTDEVLVLVDGRVTACGTHRDLLSRNEAYRSIVLRGGEQ